MHKSVLAAALGVLAAAAPLARAGSSGIGVGDRAPLPEAKETIDLPSYSPESLDGKLVFLEIFRTW